MTTLLIVLKISLYAAGAACIVVGVVDKLNKGGRK